MYQASERCGGGIHLVDRLFLRNTVYVGGYKDGRKGDCPVSDCAGSAIFLLYCRISCFALVSLYISAVPVVMSIRLSCRCLLEHFSFDYMLSAFGRAQVMA